MDITKYIDKGITGLQNLGNTCFINSAIQCTFNIYELNKIMDDENIKKKFNNKPDTIVLLEWDNLRKMYWDENCTISPGGFVSNIRKISRIKDKDIFSGYAQNDLPEFLLFIIDCFHNALSREVIMNINGVVLNNKDKMAKDCYTMMQKMYKKEYSEVLTLFFGIHVSSIISQTNNILSTTPEPFLNLSLPIKSNNCNIYDCFDLYLENETLDGDNAWLNEKTKKKEPVTKKIQFWSLPKIMIIDFKRFNNQLKKDNSYIYFPLDDLDMKKYVNEYNNFSYIYDLFGICNHIGGVTCGHYTSFIKNANGKWYHYDDITVNEVPKSTIITTNAYCLFYRKKY